MNNSNVTANSSLDGSDSQALCFPPSPNSDLTKALKTFLYCVIILVSLLGNSLVIIVVYKRRKMRTTTNFMIVNMAVSDLFFALFTTPPSIRRVYAGADLLVGGITAQLICKLVTFIQQASIGVSILSLTGIAFDRFFAIIVPFRKVITCRTTRYLIALTWLTSTLFAAPMLYANRIVVNERENGTICKEIWEPLFDSEKAIKTYTFVHFSFFYAGPLTIITVLYTAIVIELWRGSSTTHCAQTNYQEVEKSNRKVLKMLVTVLVVFALFWLPVYIFQFMYYIGDNICSVSGLIQFIGYFLCQATSAVNPLIYAFFSENYRSGFRDCLRAMVHCQGKQLFQKDSSSSGKSVGGRREEKVKLYIL